MTTPFKISVISVFPELHETFISTSLIGRAVADNKVSFTLYKMSDVCAPGERIDEPTCGPGSGMVIKPTVVEKLFDKVIAEQGDGVRIFFSPQGHKLDQKFVQELATVMLNHVPTKNEQTRLEVCNNNHIILFCSRYEGIDERVWQEYADIVLSIGDFVLMGGDVAAHAFIEAFLRFLPGVVGKASSVENDSFSGPFLDYPTYGLPTRWHDMDVPEILLSGNHSAIEKWREEQATLKTVLSRFDWFRSSRPSQQDRARALKSIPNHYVALMHTGINIKDGRVGHTSVTSLDIHDIARSSATYDIKNYFIVTPLEDQKKIVNTFLTFWHSGQGRKYNQSRFTAVERVELAPGLDQVIKNIRAKEGQDPVIIATSAKQHKHAQIIDYHSQGIVWANEQPVLFLFGTGQGLSDEVLDRCNYLLLPVNGMGPYNHLSVRSAVAIVLDRWLGLQPRQV